MEKITGVQKLFSLNLKYERYIIWKCMQPDESKALVYCLFVFTFYWQTCYSFVEVQYFYIYICCIMCNVYYTQIRN